MRPSRTQTAVSPFVLADSVLAPARPISAEAPRALPWRDGLVGRRGGLVVGSDGRPESIAPLRLAGAVAAWTGERVHVVSALGGWPRFADGFTADLPDAAEAGTARVRSVRRLVREAAGASDAWTAEVREGLPPPVLAAVAEERDARLLLVGLGLRRLRDRQLGGEQVLRIARHAPVPLLAAAPEAARLPQSAVVAVDFGASSVRAALAALDLLGGQGTLYLVHVRPPLDELPPARTASPLSDGEPSALRAASAGYPESLDRWFDQLRDALGAGAQVLLRPVSLRGRPPEMLLDFAERVRADLVACGTQGPTAPEPCFVGSVASALVRGARCSVLLAPPPAGA